MPAKSDLVSVEVKTSLPADAQGIVILLAAGSVICGDAPHLLNEEVNASLKKLIDAKLNSGKVGDVSFDLLDEKRRVIVVGVGDARKLDPEAIRRAGGAIARAARKHNLSKLAIVPPVLREPGLSGAEAVVTGLLLADFRFTEYHGTGQPSDANKRGSIRLTVLATPASIKDVRPQVERGRTIAEAQNFARYTAHRPGNDINPPALASLAQAVARDVKLQCTVLDEKQMKKLGMGGILAVGSGSSLTPPKLIVLEHRKGPKGQKPILLVGKAITFDTGGISIKPADKMGSMIFDKCGAMAVLGTMMALAKLGTPINVVGILSSAENHVSASAYRPGDILRMYNGVTVQVTNTDAEGRLVLGDALAWGVETYKPAAVVDIATLTGGCVVALGTTMAGVMSNNDALVHELELISKLTGEKIWRLPLGPDQRDQIKGDDADIVNSAGRWASPLQGGAFLSYFVPTDGSIPWAHIDIAGVSDHEKDGPYYRRGATGWGVRTFVEWLTMRASDKPVSLPPRPRSRGRGQG